MSLNTHLSQLHPGHWSFTGQWPPEPSIFLVMFLLTVHLVFSNYFGVYHHKKKMEMNDLKKLRR